MTYLGIDFGEKRVGIAVSDESNSIATPLVVLENDSHLMQHIEKHVAECDAETIVVGDSKSISGSENKVGEKNKIFVEKLTQLLDVPVVSAGEAFSSVEAARFAPKTDRHNDAAAAAIILQRFLDTR